MIYIISSHPDFRRADRRCTSWATFCAAKACGVRVNEFAIGMGPAILKKTKGETTYALRLLPIGGFCAMEGEEEASDDPRALSNQGFWKKLIIFAAGRA